MFFAIELKGFSIEFLRIILGIPKSLTLNTWWADLIVLSGFTYKFKSHNIHIAIRKTIRTYLEMFRRTLSCYNSDTSSTPILSYVFILIYSCDIVLHI